MKAFIIQFPFGVTAFDEQKALIEKVLFTRKPQAAARSLLKTESGKLSDEVFSLITLLKNAGYDTFVFENANLADEAMRKMGIKTEVAKPAEAEVLRSKMNTVAIESGFAADEQELSLWNRNVSLELAKLRIKGASEKRDLIVAQGIQTLDDLDRTVNLFMGRLREWYGVYFPELDRLIEKHETYARLAMNLGYKEDFTLENLEKENIPKERAALVVKAAESSMGADISDADLKQIQSLAKNVLELYELRKETERFVDRTMEEMAPNVRTVAGALLGARLIALAGSLQNLAIRPASTIQVLGAEKALFRSLKTGARPPKHGLIFQHTLLHDAKRWQRGKIARAIAGKLAIAARADVFGGKYIGDMLKEEINKRIDEIHVKYKEPPPPKEPKQRAERAEGGFRERREGGGERPFRPREGGQRSFRPREGGERPFRPREGGNDHSDPVKEAIDHSDLDKKDSGLTGHVKAEKQNTDLKKNDPSNLKKVENVHSCTGKKEKDHTSLEKEKNDNSSHEKVEAVNTSKNDHAESRQEAAANVGISSGETSVPVRVKPHPEFKEIYEVTLEDGAKRLATKNLTPGLTVYGERLVKFKGVEYRVWDAFRSKLAGAIIKGLQNVPIEPGNKVLYLGAASGTTPSHVSDIVGEIGHVYCVEFAQRSIRDLVNNVATYRNNISPILDDARMPERYAMFISGKVDTIYCDVAQPEQAKLLADNSDMFLKPQGWVMLACKSQSIDVTMNPDAVYQQEAKILHNRRFDVKEIVHLEPFDKAHAMIVAQRI